MYVYYEEFRDASGELTLMELVISGDGRTGALGKMTQTSKANFAILCEYLKSIRADKRGYDATSHIWTYLGKTGEAVIQAINAGINGGLLLAIIQPKKITDLQHKVKCGCLNQIDRPKSAPHKEVEIKFSEEDFFYTPEPQSKTLSKDELLKRLTALLDTSPEPFIQLEKSDSTAAKKLYRRAALKLHPDRNNGDGSKMSELNMLWTMYTV